MTTGATERDSVTADEGGFVDGGALISSHLAAQSGLTAFLCAVE